MRVAFIVRDHFGNLGSTASFMFPSIMAKHIDVLVLASAPEQRIAPVFRDSGLKVQYYHNNSPEVKINDIISRLMVFKPDIVHLFQGPDCLKLLYYGKAMLKNTRFLLDFRSPLLMKGGKNRKKILLRYFFSQFVCDRILSHSLNTISQNIYFRFRRVYEVPPGVDIESFKKMEKKGNKAERFVYIGSISKGRQVALLVDAFTSYVELTKENITLDLYGDGDVLNELKRKVRLEKLSFIKFHGSVPYRQLMSEISKYDVGIAFVPNGRYERAPSLKSLEYAAAGLTVIASNTFGQRDYARHHHLRFYYFNNSQEGIKRAIFDVRSMDELRLLGDAKWNREIMKNQSWEKIVENRLLPLYSKLLKQKGIMK